jgi:hypothetical protein
LGSTIFLSALSYELTYKIKAKRFSEIDLITCYKKLCPRFGLPAQQATEVAREIESHTGIITIANHFEFEFSHLSLQEFLCANHIVREPRGGQIPKYIHDYPPPLAIAIALSAEPSVWFADFILKFGDKQYFTDRSLQVFLSRLIIEKPRFEPSLVLGYAVLKLFFEFYENNNRELRDQLNNIIKYESLKESMALALAQYWIEKSNSEPGEFFYLVWQNRTTDLSVGADFGLKPPGNGRFFKELLLDILSNSPFPMFWCETWGGLGSRLQINGKRYNY